MTPETTTYHAAGLTCEHCAAAVRDELTALPGVRDVEVQLAPDGISTLRVTADEPLLEEDVAAALDEAGDYELVR